jgi:hypothetical protein
MALDQILVTIFGLLLASSVGWYFWFSEAKGTRLQASAGGFRKR